MHRMLPWRLPNIHGHCGQLLRWIRDSLLPKRHELQVDDRANWRYADHAIFLWLRHRILLWFCARMAVWQYRLLLLSKAASHTIGILSNACCFTDGFYACATHYWCFCYWKRVRCYLDKRHEYRAGRLPLSATCLCVHYYTIVFTRPALCKCFIDFYLNIPCTHTSQSLCTKAIQLNNLELLWCLLWVWVRSYVCIYIYHVLWLYVCIYIYHAMYHETPHVLSFEHMSVYMYIYAYFCMRLFIQWNYFVLSLSLSLCTYTYIDIDI
jgi:hypothetical protein